MTYLETTEKEGNDFKNILLEMDFNATVFIGERDKTNGYKLPKHSWIKLRNLLNEFYDMLVTKPDNFLICICCGYQTVNKETLKCEHCTYQHKKEQF